MVWYEATITHTWQDAATCTLWLDCPAQAIPAAGQYVQAHLTADAALPATLFPVEIAPSGFRALLPANSPPPFNHQKIIMRGPLGHGFTPPAALRRLLLAATAETLYRLLPLVAAYTPQADIVLCTDLPVAGLPTAVEIYPLRSFAELINWSDYIALDVLATALPQLPNRLSLPPQTSLPCPAQMLIITPMPCGALAECGACATATRHGHKLACKDGPVFNFAEMMS
jgi:dihydroorotate dehydrogenase electron transfer subunit